MSTQLKKYMQVELKLEEVKEEDGIGIIKGYASTFGNVDQGMDICERGCFAKSISEKKGKFPILLDHDVTKQVGWNLEASENDYGLKIHGEVQLVTPEAMNRYKLAKRAQEIGAKAGLSIGYSVIKSEPDRDRPIIRRLKELKLWEYSFVTFPMNESATIDSVKSLKKLFDDLVGRGYSEQEIKEALLKTGLLPDRQKPPSQEVDPETLQSADKLLKLLTGG